LIKKDVRYDRLGTSERALMDVYVPSTKSVRASTVNEEEEGEDLMTTLGRKTPMAVFVHGGVWASGERWQFAPLAYRLAQEGICCAVISYSLFPEKRAKEQSEDVLNALRFALRMASVFGADENRTHLVGHSAGSHLCAMALLSNNEERNKETMIVPKVKSFIGLCGVYNIETHFEYEGTRGVSMLSTMGRAMGGNDKFKEMSPFHIVNNYESGENDFEHFPQTYLFSSLCDVVVPHRESKDFHDVLTKKGIKSELKIYDDGNHGDFALGFKKHPKNLKPYHKDLVELLLA
jgi:prenylcysteine alpha-carboxyl methylesterase